MEMGDLEGAAEHGEGEAAEGGGGDELAAGLDTLWSMEAEHACEPSAGLAPGPGLPRRASRLPAPCGQGTLELSTLAAGRASG